MTCVPGALFTEIFESEESLSDTGESGALVGIGDVILITSEAEFFRGGGEFVRKGNPSSGGLLGNGNLVGGLPFVTYCTGGGLAASETSGSVNFTLVVGALDGTGGEFASGEIGVISVCVVLPVVFALGRVILGEVVSR